MAIAVVMIGAPFAGVSQTGLPILLGVACIAGLASAFACGRVRQTKSGELSGTVRCKLCGRDVEDAGSPRNRSKPCQECGG